MPLGGYRGAGRTGLGRNGKTERSWVVVWKPRVTAQMRRGEAGRSRRWPQNIMYICYIIIVIYLY